MGTKDIIEKDSNKQILISQQITGAVIIVFFGIFTIGYIFFINTYFMKKNDSLMNSTWFKIPMLLLTLISTIIIIMIISNNSQDNSAVISIMIVLTIIIFLKMGYSNFLTKEFKEEFKEKMKKYTNCINAATGYGDNTGCNNEWLSPFGQPLLSFVLPLIFGLFITISAKIENTLNKIIFGILSAILILEYILIYDYIHISFF
jgi:hypothetical protein